MIAVPMLAEVAASGAAPAEPVIAVEGLAAAYGGREVFAGLNLELLPAEVLCLIGHNGAGKSTLLKVLFGLHPAARGTIRLCGKTVTPVPRLMAEKGFAYVPEGRGVFPGLTVKENFALALWSAAIGGAEADVRTDEVLSVLPRLKEFWTRRAGQLSGGQQQMVSIGRALLCRPAVLLLDEPSIGLAPKLFQDLLQPIREVQQQRGMSILLVEQQVGEAFGVSDRVIAMKSGEIVFRGVPDDLRDHARLLQLF